MMCWIKCNRTNIVTISIVRNDEWRRRYYKSVRAQPPSRVYDDLNRWIVSSQLYDRKHRVRGLLSVCKSSRRLVATGNRSIDRSSWDETGTCRDVHKWGVKVYGLCETGTDASTSFDTCQNQKCSEQNVTDDDNFVNFLIFYRFNSVELVSHATKIRYQFPTGWYYTQTDLEISRIIPSKRRLFELQLLPAATVHPPCRRCRLLKPHECASERWVLLACRRSTKLILKSTTTADTTAEICCNRFVAPTRTYKPPQ